jgi:hypothetical protein
MVEFRGWWIVLDAVCWIFILIVFGMGVFGAWPPSPWGVLFIAGLALACVVELWAWRSVRAGRRPPDAGTAD